MPLVYLNKTVYVCEKKPRLYCIYTDFFNSYFFKFLLCFIGDNFDLKITLKSFTLRNTIELIFVFDCLQNFGKLN